MTIQNVSLFKAITTKMSYLNERQAVISENIANADTPGYRPQDLEELDFRSMLRKSTGETVVNAQATRQGHVSGAADGMKSAGTRGQKTVYEVSPSGNSVIIEEQMIKSTETTMDYNLMSSLLQKNVGMIRMAIGRIS